MSWLKRYKARQIIAGIIWILAGCGTIVLMAAAVKQNNNRICYGVEVKITGASKHLFIDEQDVKKILEEYAGNKLNGNPVRSFDLQKIERIIERDIWVNNAELYVDINGILQIRVDEREPIARIFTASNNSYYIDSSLKMLPLSDKVAARVPVFTGFPAETAILNDGEKKLLRDVRDLSEAIASEPFLHALIEQVNIQKGKYELIPKIGDQIILLGEAEDYRNKLDNLKLFYKDVMTKTSWNRYSEINLQFKNQIVAKVRTKEDVVADSLRTMQLMKLIAEYTERMAGDTVLNVASENERPVDISIVLQSVQRDEELIESSASANPSYNTETIESGFVTIPGAVKKIDPVVVKPVPKKVVTNKPASTKPVTTKPKQSTTIKKTELPKPIAKPKPPESKSPKAVMQKPNNKPNNDY